MKASLVCTGSYLPENLIKNEDFSQFPSASLKLIGEKTGILSRHRSSPDESTSTLAIKAAEACLQKAAFPAGSLDAVILATSTPDRLIPATATKLAKAIGATRAFAFDMNSVCSGSVFALEVARSLLVGGAVRNILVVAADTYSKFLNPSDFSTAPYFGDGAGAALISSELPGAELLAGVLHSDGNGYETISIKAGAGEIPAPSVTRQSDCYFKMNGREVFEFAVKRGAEVIDELLKKHDIGKDEIASLVLHQANINILDAISKSVGIDRQLFYSNLQRVGNTASASVLIALDHHYNTVGNCNGKYHILASFGGGLSWGACAIKRQ